MKNKFLCLCAILLSALLLFSGCGKEEPKASDKAISVGKQAVEVADDYLDGKSTYDTAYDKLDALLEELDYVDDLTDSDENYPYDFYIQLDVLDVQTQILLDDMKSTAETYDNILKSRNDLADEVGISSR